MIKRLPDVHPQKISRAHSLFCDLLAWNPWVDAKYFVGWRQAERGAMPRKAWVDAKFLVSGELLFVLAGDCAISLKNVLIYRSDSLNKPS